MRNYSNKIPGTRGVVHCSVEQCYAILSTFWFVKSKEVLQGGRLGGKSF